MHRILQAMSPVLLLLAFAGHAALASTMSYTGDLRTDATVTACGSNCVLGVTSSDADYAQYAAVVVPVQITTASSLTAVSFSYGGGTNATGTQIADSGFEPYFSLFDPSGAFVTSTYLGTTCPAGANANPTLGGCYDELLDAGTLAPGTYSLALSAYENMSFAENYGSGTLADGFTGLGNLNFGEDLHYAFDVTLTPASVIPPPPSPVPEPSSLVLFGPACVALLTCKQRFLRPQSM